MPKAREVKSRIANIKDIKQITKAMNAIAMAKVTKLKKQLTQARPYYESLEKKKQILLDDSSNNHHPLTQISDTDSIGVISFNSDRGLAGNYSIDINRATRDFILSEKEKNRVVLFAGGEKGAYYFRSWEELEETWAHFYENPQFHHAERIAMDLQDRFVRDEIAELWAIYMKHHSDLNQELTVEKVLPITKETQESRTGDNSDTSNASRAQFEEYLFEPKKKEILDNFLRTSFAEKIYWILLNTKTSEHAIRRRSMRDATDNANELIDELTLTYNKARQQQITREIADIIGGAEALREEE